MVTQGPSPRGHGAVNSEPARMFASELSPPGRCPCANTELPTQLARPLRHPWCPRCQVSMYSPHREWHLINHSPIHKASLCEARVSLRVNTVGFRGQGGPAGLPSSCGSRSSLWAAVLRSAAPSPLLPSPQWTLGQGFLVPKGFLAPLSKPKPQRPTLLPNNCMLSRGPPRPGGHSKTWPISPCAHLTQGSQACVIS